MGDGGHRRRGRPPRGRRCPRPRRRRDDACGSRRRGAPLTVGYLALGSNLGDREAHLAAARATLERRRVHVLRASSIRETEPFGVTDQPRFLNQVLEVDWEGTPRQLLEVVKGVELEVGRTPTFRWGPREIDVDILLLGEHRVDEPDLVIPHPGLAEREFVRLPLRELRPDILD